MEKPERHLAVIMQRRVLANRWQSVEWRPWSVLESDEARGPARLLVDRPGEQQWLHPGFRVVLHREEAEGYYLNATSGKPSAFVLWRVDDEAGVPVQVTLSYQEGARWLDGGHSVDHVGLPAPLVAWMGVFVEEHYRPEPKRRVRPRSFLPPKDRAAP